MFRRSFGSLLFPRFSIGIPQISTRSCSQSEEVKMKFSVPPHLALPQFVHGRWRGARISGRQMGVLKKEFRDRGEEWVDPRPWKQNQGRRPYRTLDKCKGHKWERQKEAKLKKIEENMKKMPDLIKKYHREERLRRQKTLSEEEWLYPHEIARFQKKKQKKQKKSEDDDREILSRAELEAGDDHGR